ncbi:dephospho-CoA kinase [Rhodoferax sp. OV413]|uniref:dephospho-CoA kinase n=1 Tax=Rhodoferax sp. OV413 TaxID=1855285 RepID=UPI00088AE0B6|nr:dephospho-CoA kinase [Rhodoferax sp. OV413]SDP19161.1 dephospho-CoA kinase [Rhodoferax sp. OV413]
MQPCLRIGLTGGIGSGKSTVAQMLQDLGATVVDADAISRAATAAGGSAIEAIRATFGAQFITTEGAMDRDRMRALAFSEPDAKKRLEAIVHPLVGQAIEAQFQAAQAAGSRCVVFDIPLLVESGHWRHRLDQILVVDCLEDTQVARVLARNGLDEATVRKVIQTQASRTERLAVADWVIFNDGLTLDQLRAEVRKIAPHFGL